MDETPLIMALDTSHMKGSVAVSRGKEILCEIVFDASDTHSATLLPAVDSCLKTAKAVVEEIDIFSVVTGPGSFTGLRIGLATIKGLAAVGRKPVLTANSLEVLASAFPFSTSPVAPVVDARRGEVYFGVYDTSGGSPLELVEPVAVKPEGIGGMLESQRKDRFIFCGTGIHRIRAHVPEENLFADPFRAVPSASLLISVTFGRDPVSYEGLSGLEPLYIRPPDAKLPSGSKLKSGGGTG